jgi:hypothetical protein
MTAKPPITPPTIAPTGLEELLLDESLLIAPGSLVVDTVDTVDTDAVLDIVAVEVEAVVAIVEVGGTDRALQVKLQPPS